MSTKNFKERTKVKSEQNMENFYLSDPHSLGFLLTVNK